MSAASNDHVKSSKDKNHNTLGDLSCYADTDGVVTTTMNSIPGYRVVKVLGTVFGLCVRSRNIGANIVSGLKSLAGGELGYLTNLLYSGRNQAIERMVGEAIARGGNAIIAMRFDTSEVSGGYAQVAAYGTAVRVERIEDEATRKQTMEQDDMEQGIPG
jgi:uncharacterized protein YbjQ (UPF0145 family)